MPLTALTWLVICVLIYTSFSMIHAARTERKAEGGAATDAT